MLQPVFLVFFLFIVSYYRILYRPMSSVAQNCMVGGYSIVFGTVMNAWSTSKVRHDDL